MTDVIRIISEAEFIEGPRSSIDEPRIPPFTPHKDETEIELVSESPAKVAHLEPDQNIKKSLELEVIYFKSSHGAPGDHEARTKRIVENTLKYDTSDPYNELISTSLVILQHLDFIRGSIFKVKAILEEPCPGHEDEFPPATRLQAWKFVVEYGIQCLGKPRPSEAMNSKAVKGRLEKSLASTLTEVDRALVLALEFIKNLNVVEKQVVKVQLLAAKVFKENLKSAEAVKSTTTHSSYQNGVGVCPQMPINQTMSTIPPRNLIPFRNLWIRSAIDGISLKTGSRHFWIKLLTISLQHKFSMLSIFLTQLCKFGIESEALLKNAQNLLLIPMISEGMEEVDAVAVKNRTKAEHCSVQSLVYHIPTLLRSKKKKFTPKEEVMGLRVCWKLGIDFAQTKAELIGVTEILTAYRDSVKGLYKNRNLALSGRAMPYFEGSQQLTLLVESLGEGVDLGTLFDVYSVYGTTDTTKDDENRSFENLNWLRPNLAVDSDTSAFTIIDSTQTLNGHTVDPEMKKKSELDIPLEEIQVEYETAFVRVKSSGVLTDPEILLCSDAVKAFLDKCTSVIKTLETNTERLRTSLQTLESDAYKQFPGILVWTHLIIKTILITNFSSTWKERLAGDLIILFEIQERLEASVLKHEMVLNEFKEYVLQFLQELKTRDVSLTEICNDVIESDHFESMLAYTEQKLYIPNVHFERDEFSIRISFMKNEFKIFSIPASGSTQGTRLVKFSILEKRTTISLLTQAMELVGSLLSTTEYSFDSGTRVLTKGGSGRTLKVSDLKNLSKLQAFEKLAILIGLKAVLSSLAQNFVVFSEVRFISRQLNHVFEAFKLLLQFEEFPIPTRDDTDLGTVPPAVPIELKKQFMAFSMYHYIPSENHALMKIVEAFHSEHGMSFTEVVRHEDRLWGHGLQKPQPLIVSPDIVIYKGWNSSAPRPQEILVAKPPAKIYRKVPIGLFLREMPKLVHAIVDEDRKLKVKPLDSAIEIDNRMTGFFNLFTTYIQSKILLAVRSLHLPKASVYVEKISETRPVIGQLEALCFFIGLASTQLNSKTLPVETQVYNKLRPKFLAFTHALVAFQNMRKDVYACIWKRVDSHLSSLEYENKDKLEQIHGEEIPGLGELHKMCPVPPQDLATYIWKTEKTTENIEKSIPDDKLMIFHWNVWRHDVLEVEHKTNCDFFEYSGMTFRSRGKLLDHMMDHALNILNKSLAYLNDSKTDITEAGRVFANIKTYLFELDRDFQIRPEQTYMILRTLRARVVGVNMYLDRTESVLKRCRFFLSHGIRHIRAHLHEVESFTRDFGDNPFHYLSLRVELELVQPMGIVRHADVEEIEFISSPTAEQDSGPIGDQGQDHARTMLKFFESFGNEVHRLGTLLVSGLQITHSSLSSPSACTDKSTEPSVPKIVGLAILIGQVMIEIRTYTELTAKEHSILNLVHEVENTAEEFPNRNSNKVFGKNPKAKLIEAIESTEETVTKISNLLKTPFNMAGGLEPNVMVRDSIDSKLFPYSMDDTSLSNGATGNQWNLSITDSAAKLILTREATADQIKFSDLNTMKQAGILKQLLDTLHEILRQGSKTLEGTAVDSVKDAGSRLKLIKHSLKVFLKSNPPNADESFDLTTILDDLHFSMELVKGTWTQINLEMKTVCKILTCAAAYMRLRFTTAGVKAMTNYLPAVSKNPHPHKRAVAAALTHLEDQIQRKYTSKLSEVEEHLKSLVVTPLSITLNLHLNILSRAKKQAS